MKDKSFNYKMFTASATGLILIFLFLLLTSCSKEPIEWKDKHSLIFDIDNPNYYSFSDHHPDSAHYANTKVKNGYQLGRGIKYTFTIEGDIITVESARSNIEVKYAAGTLQDFTPVPVENKVFVQKLSTKDVNHNGVFIIEQPWLH